MQLELECNTLATWSSLCFMHMQFVYPLHDRGRLPLSLNGVSVRGGGNYRIHYNSRRISGINDVESIFGSRDV